jgi:hypothetical protein
MKILNWNTNWKKITPIQKGKWWKKKLKEKRTQVFALRVKLKKKIAPTKKNKNQIENNNIK